MKPGDLVDTVSYDDGNGQGLVPATSRHKATVDEADAREELLAEAVVSVIGRTDVEPFRQALEHAQVFTWRSVTKAEVDGDLHECENDRLCTPGSWCTEGRGAAWVRLIELPNSALYAIDEELAGEADR